MQAVEALGEATQSAGPLDSKSRALVKLAIAIGGLREGAVHSHAITTIGFPSTMAAMSWVEDILRK